MTPPLGYRGRSNRMRRVFFFLAFVALAPLVEAQSVVRGPYLQSGTPSGIIVLWRTDLATDSVVRFGPAPGSLTQTASNPSPTTEHAVSIDGLLPNTQYFYSVGTSSQELAGNNGDHFFVTSPPSGDSKPTRIWVIGDSGTADADARAVRDAFLNFTGARVPELWLMLGDNAYADGTDAEYQAAVFDMYPGLLRKSVLWPTLGNHDAHTANSASQSGPYYDIFDLPTDGAAGGVPSGTEAYYSFDYGNIHFVCLDSADSDVSPSGSMLTWLVTDLQNNDKPWLLAFWHHPPYSKGSHDSDTSGSLSDMRENALPILEDYGVDLVFSGHSHSYERSYLIDGHYDPSGTFGAIHQKDSGDGSELGDGAYEKPFSARAPNEGAVYTVAGSSGKTSGGSLDHPAMVISLDSLGSVVLDFDGVRMDAKFLDDVGNVLDDFTILKGPDTNPPVMTSVTAAGSGSEVVVTYSERVEASSAVDVANYAIGNGVAVTQAVLSGDALTVTVSTTPLSPGTYWLTVNNVSDLAGNVIDVDSQASFDFVENFNPSFQDGVLPDATYFGTVDTTLSESQPNSNFGSSSSLSVDGSASSGADDYTLLKWDVTAIPSGSAVTAADITVQVTNSTSGPYELYEVLRAWVENEVTWNQAAAGSSWEIPGARGSSDRGAAVLGTIGSAGSGTFTISLNAVGRSIVESWVNDPTSNHGIVIANPDTSNGLGFSSRESGTAVDRPRLNVSFTSGDSEPPTAPSGLNVSPTSETEVNLSWTASTDDTGIAEYVVYEGGIETGTTTGTSFISNGLTPDTSYAFFVTAVDLAANESVPSETVTVTTDPDTVPPSSPGTPTLDSNTDTSATFSWPPSTDNVGVVGYDVYENGTMVGSTSASTTTFARTGLAPATAYSYVVIARDGAGNESAPSGTLDVTTPDTVPPSTPGIPTLDSKTDTTATFSWPPSTDNVGVVGYDVYENGTMVGSTSASTTTFARTGLAPATAYSYVVIARDGAGNESAPSGTLDVTTPDTVPPSTPGTPTLDSNTDTSATFSWPPSTDNVGVVGYDVQENGTMVGSTSASTTTFARTGLAPATTYSYTVIARDGSNNVSVPSNALAVTTDPTPDTEPPSTPGIPTLDSKTDTTATFSWPPSTDNVGVVGYDVQENGTMVGSTSASTTTFARTGLAPATTYSYTVTARDGSNNVSVPSNALAVTTDPSPQPSMHVSDITMELRRFGKWQSGRAVVSVADANGIAVEGATAAVQWSGLAANADSGITAGGVIQFDSEKATGTATGEFALTVTDVTAVGYTYDPAANVEAADCVRTDGQPCEMGPPDPPTSMSVAAIHVAISQQGKNSTGTATVTVVDEFLNLVPGVLVEGDWAWNSTWIGSASGVTDGEGVASIDSSKQKASSGDEFEFTVTNLTLDGYVYSGPSGVQASSIVP